MTKRLLKVSNALEARPAALFVQTASKFQSNIYIEVDKKNVNAKSIMGIMSIGILDGQTITITANGEDELEAITELDKFLSTAQ